jgi:MOSC domain-containing protein YiiM
LKLGRDDIVKRFLETNRSGIYFVVLEEGFVYTGDPVERIKENEDPISVMEINRAFVNSMDDIPLLRHVVRYQVLPPGLREHFLTQLAAIEER